MKQVFIVGRLEIHQAEIALQPSLGPSFAINSRSRRAGLKVSPRIPLRLF